MEEDICNVNFVLIIAMQIAVANTRGFTKDKNKQP